MFYLLVSHSCLWHFSIIALQLSKHFENSSEKFEVYPVVHLICLNNRFLSLYISPHATLAPASSNWSLASQIIILHKIWNISCYFQYKNKQVYVWKPRDHYIRQSMFPSQRKYLVNLLHLYIMISWKNYVVEFWC